MADKDAFGRAGEARAAQYLEQEGFTVLARNWRCRTGEIDLVVGDGTTVVVVEVKTRRGEAIDARKRARLWRLAVEWATTHTDLMQGRRLRIDAIGLIGAEPGIARLEHLVDVEVP